jgi:uncharacterized membrane protein
MPFEQVEALVQACVSWLRLFVETLGAIVIAVGIVGAVIGLVRHATRGRRGSFTPIRLAFARYLTLALELQLAADILSTSIAPSWQSIGKLAAIAVIRTALNYFLSREMKDELAAEEPALDARDAPHPAAARQPASG